MCHCFCSLWSNEAHRLLHAYAHARTAAHTYTYARAHTYAHTYRCARTHTRAHARSHKHTHTHTHTHTHSRVHIHTHTHTHTHTHIPFTVRAARHSMYEEDEREKQLNEPREKSEEAEMSSSGRSPHVGLYSYPLPGRKRNPLTAFINIGRVEVNFCVHDTPLWG